MIIEPIPLTANTELKKYLELIDFLKNLWEEECKKMLITYDKLGEPKPQ